MGASSSLQAQVSERQARERQNAELFKDISSIPEVSEASQLRLALGDFFLNRKTMRLPQGSASQALQSLPRPDNTAIFDSQRRLLARATAGSAGSIIKHIRSEEGVPFPEKSTSPTLALTENPSFKQALNQNQTAMTQALSKFSFSAPALPKCRESKTVAIPLPQAQQEPVGYPQSERATMDILYLAEDPPVDAAEIFGATTIIHRFSQQQKDYVSYFAGLIGAHCLPFRMRQTAHQIYWDTGLNALKNYSSDPDGEGELHAYIKAKHNID